MIMKNMRKYIFLLCTICMGLVSCIKENMSGVEADGLTTFKVVYADAATKTVLDGVTPMWTPEDKICIYDGRNNEFSNTLTTPAKTAEFKGVLGGNEQRYLAAIPYNVDLMFDLDKKGVYGLVMPYEQNAVENSCDPAALVAATYTENFELKFNNMCSLIKFEMASDDVKSVKVVANGGESLSGQYNVALSTDPKFTPSMGRKPEVVLKGDFKKGSTYYVSVIPASLQSGFTIYLNEDIKSFEFKNAAAFARNAITSIGKLSLNIDESGFPGEDDADINGGGSAEKGVVYLMPNSNWLEAGARFAAYFFEEGMPETWVDLVADTVSGVYKCDVPEGYTNVIFVRMNPSSTVNSWDEGVKWGQTGDLKIPSGNDVCFALEANSWEAGSWTSYPPTGNVEPNPDTPGEGVETAGTIYMRANSNWLEAGARFAAYFWQDGKENVWRDMAQDVEANVYKCDVPAGYANVIFVRMNPSSTVNSWDEGVKWGQTGDLMVPTGDSVCYVIAPDTWGEDGYWTTYPPVVVEPENPTPEQPGETPDGPGQEEQAQVRIYVSSAWGWPYLWCWDSNGGQIFAGAQWPGTKYHGEENGYYYWDVPSAYVGQTVSLLAVKGDQSEQTSDFNNVVLDKNVYFKLEWTQENGCHLIKENK